MMLATRQAEKRERNRLRDRSRSIVMATSQTPPTPSKGRISAEKAKRR